VYVWSDATPPVTDFTLESAQGDWSTGGWEFKVKLYDQAQLENVLPRSKVFLCAQNYYNDVPLNMGPLAGYENIVATGWIDGESISFNPEQSTVNFTVQGPQWWLDHIASWPAGIRDVTGNPAEWNEYKNFTYDAFLWHIIRWRCTVSEIMDVFPSGNTVRQVGATAPWGTIWSQITQVGDSKLLIHPCFNRYGQLYTQIDTNYLTNTARAGVPTVMDLTDADWRDTIEIEWRTIQEVGFMDLSGMTWNGTSANGYRAGSWGTAVGRYGKMEKRTELCVSSEATGQTETNELAGILLGQMNNDFPRITVPLLGNNPFFDICPNQYGTITVEENDTPRRIVLTEKKFIPRTITLEWDKDSGLLSTTIMGEGANTPAHGFYLPFFTGPLYTPPPIRPRNPWSPRKGLRPPKIGNLCTNLMAPATGPYTVPINKTVQTYGGIASYDIPFHAKLRAGDSLNPTKISVYYTAYVSTLSSPGDSDWTTSPNQVNMRVDALNASGSPIAAAGSFVYTGPAQGYRTFTFTPPVATEIFGFRLTAIEAESEPTWEASGSVLASGSMLSGSRPSINAGPSGVDFHVSGPPFNIDAVLYIKTSKSNTAISAGTTIQSWGFLAYHGNSPIPPYGSWDQLGRYIFSGTASGSAFTKNSIHASFNPNSYFGDLQSYLYDGYNPIAFIQSYAIANYPDIYIRSNAPKDTSGFYFDYLDGYGTPVVLSDITTNASGMTESIDYDPSQTYTNYEIGIAQQIFGYLAAKNVVLNVQVTNICSYFSP
jgi:hypothetical protein